MRHNFYTKHFTESRLTFTITYIWYNSNLYDMAQEMGNEYLNMFVVIWFTLVVVIHIPKLNWPVEYICLTITTRIIIEKYNA